MSGENTITAILVAYNSAGIIGQALSSLVGASHIAKVIVVDNCSSDDTCDYIAREFPSVTIIENSRNQGFGRGNNLGLKKVETPYALLVNPDAVLEEGAIGELLEAAKRYPDAAILAPALYGDDGQLHQSHKKNVFNREQSGGIYTAPEGDCCAEFLSGALWLLNMSHMKSKVGYFDPAIFLYYEDDDLCLRARNHGFGLVLVPSARATHVMGASSGKASSVKKARESEFFKQRHLIWSRLYLEQKYRGEKAAHKLASKLHMGYALRAAFYTMLFKLDKVNRYRGRIAGVFEFETKKRT